MTSQSTSLSPLDVPELFDAILCHVANPPTGLGETPAPIQGLIDVWSKCRLVNKYWKYWIETSPSISKIVFRSKDPLPENCKKIKVNEIGLKIASNLIAGRVNEVTYRSTVPFSNMFSKVYITYPPVKRARVIWKKELRPFVSFLKHEQSFGARDTRLTLLDGLESSVKGFEDFYIMWIEHKDGLDVDGFSQCMNWIYKGAIEYCVSRFATRSRASPTTHVPEIDDCRHIEVEFVRDDGCVVGTGRVLLLTRTYTRDHLGRVRRIH
ncbi:hypothetical protein AA313_de0202366 [Arthrobotrys entomopaga]|nr:hypothetical protein AA313_de0202366 [Arthrobotrys entomopaga]